MILLNAVIKIHFSYYITLNMVLLLLKQLHVGLIIYNTPRDYIDNSSSTEIFNSLGTIPGMFGKFKIKLLS